jgi:hypothetical protein
VGGVAAQFFTNTGAVLTGGKLYTYAAGTTTPAVTYTSSNGATPQPNPIVLDAAGRVPNSGEIWLTDGILYKFVLKDSNDVLIATYDNVSGINSNFISFTNNQQIITATANQTVFNLSISYQPGTNSLSVFVDGVNQYGPGAQYAYTETSSTSVTFTNGLHVGAVVKFTTTQQQGAGAVNASQVTYNPAGTGAVAESVQAKLRQTVSVKDFGAVGDGTTNDTAAIQAAVTAVAAKASQGAVYLPAGVYKISSAIQIPYGVSMFGDGGVASRLECYDCDGLQFISNGYDVGMMFYEDFGLTGMSGTNRAAITSVGTTASQDGLQFNRLRIYDWEWGLVLGNDRTCAIHNSQMQKVTLPVWLNNEAVGINILNNTFVYEGGCARPGGGASPYGVFLTGPIVEGVVIQNNEIYGFGTCVRIDFAVYVVIQNNVLSSTVYSVYLNTTANTVSILDNYIEVSGNNGIGVYGGGLSTPNDTVTTIQSNSFICASGTNTTGIQLNDSANTNRFDNRIIGNYFSGFLLNDIRLNNPGTTVVDGNRCMSNVSANSIYVQTVSKPPVTIVNNWCFKALTLATASDYTSGNVILSNNASNNVYQLGKSAASPTTGTWRVGDIVYNSAPASAGYIGWVCTVAGTPGTWKTFGLIS